ncbi:hypothetical protein MBLNU459_g7985t1 [Dothideomycetes sp. NU459]
MSSPPSSPALSICDTLSSPDLDAYLDSLPALSGFPTPNMVKEAWWTDESLDIQPFYSEGAASYAANANVLCTISSCTSCTAVKALPTMVTQFLINSRLPVETIAIAYNILAHSSIASLHCWHNSSSSFEHEHVQSKMLAIHGSESDPSCQRALIILAALSVAVSYTEDCPRSLFYWSRQVSERSFSTEQISMMSRLLLAQLEWQLHPLGAPAAVDAGVAALTGCGPRRESVKPLEAPAFFDDESLRLLIGPGTALQHGLITPEPSPGLDCSFEEQQRNLPLPVVRITPA